LSVRGGGEPADEQRGEKRKLEHPTSIFRVDKRA
jgi:hypothetical protein